VLQVVTVEYKLLNIASIDTVAQSFYAEFVVDCSWVERCLVGLDEQTIDWELVWDPEPKLMNAREASDDVPGLIVHRATLRS
jgi:hypothetical protein